MRLLINSDISIYRDLFASFKIDMEPYADGMFILTLPEDAKIHIDMVLNELPEKTEKPLLREYIETNSLSLKDFITFKHRIVASGNFVPSDDNSLYDYVVSGDMRIFDKAVLTTYDYVAVGSIDVSEYEQYYEYMLNKSTTVPSPEISKSR